MNKKIYQASVLCLSSIFFACTTLAQTAGPIKEDAVIEDWSTANQLYYGLSANIKPVFGNDLQSVQLRQVIRCELSGFQQGDFPLAKCLLLKNQWQESDANSGMGKGFFNLTNVENSLELYSKLDLEVNMPADEQVVEKDKTGKVISKTEYRVKEAKTCFMDDSVPEGFARTTSLTCAHTTVINSGRPEYETANCWAYIDYLLPASTCDLGVK